jgi:hypothetical protein
MSRPFGSRNKKSIWLLESLAKSGYDYEKMLTQFLEKAAKGNHTALSMAQLLVKMVPYIANMPKTDQAQVSIDTLVINRYNSVQGVQPTIVGPDSVDTIADVDPPLPIDHP